MEVWHFSENPYSPAWDRHPPSLRVDLPNSYFEPEIGAELINRYIDEWAMCDELGLNIMVNEHHSTATCVTASCSLPMAVLARETKNCRILCLGMPIGIRADPVVVAEELSYIDVLSRGRLEMGLVKGFSTEIAPANINPATVTPRFWEAHDLILKAMTTHDGPFNWEGPHFQYRQVNIWPRPYQQPHPPVWVTGFNPTSAAPIADRGYKICAGLNARSAKSIFDAYRARFAELGKAPPSQDQFGYLVLIGIGDTEKKGHDRVRKIKGYLETTGITSEAFLNPQGYAPVATNVAALRRGNRKAIRVDTTRDARPIQYSNADVPDLIQAGTCFAGTPDQVYEQIADFHDYVGGFGHILGMMQGGHLSHAETVKNITLFSKEVLPRLEGLKVSPNSQDN